mmetsp:Transcript_59388/g.140260  ORF Transcript_59388/g.140260 Transcript_59388/m.140260 type:complete len:682 (-) Transcript_59388:1318-3363(-)
MLRVDLKRRLALRGLLAGLLEQARQVAGDIALLHDDAGRRVDQAGRHADILGAVLQRVLELVDQRLERLGDLFGLLLLVLVLQLAQVHGPLGDGLQRLAVELVEVAEHPLVHAVHQQQHLDALLAEDLQLRAGLGRGERVCGDVVDGLLALLHAADVVRQAHALVGMRGREAEQLGQALLVLVVLADAFLQHLTEVLPEVGVLLLFGGVFAVGQALQHAEHPLGRSLADRLHIAAFLQQLAADVQRQVGRVDHALHEAQVDRHQRLGVVHDEDALDVELHTAALVTVPQVEGRLLRDVEQLGVLAAALDAVVRVGQWCFGVIGDLLVELLVLLSRDVALAARPQGRGLVDRLPLVGDDLLGGFGVPGLLAHQDGQGDVVAVLADDRLHPPGLQELLLALAQVQDDVGAAARLGDGFQVVLTGAFAAPAHGLVGWQPGAAGLDRDAVGDDEARVEAHAELADQLGVLLLVALEPGHELARAALGDGAEVGGGFFGAHADAVVADGQRLGLLVETDAHLEVGLVLEQCGVVQRLEAQLVAGIAGIADQFAQEDLLVGVQAVGDEVQDLLDFGLEGVGLLGHGRGCRERKRGPSGAASEGFKRASASIDLVPGEGLAGRRAEQRDAAACEDEGPPQGFAKIGRVGGDIREMPDLLACHFITAGIGHRLAVERGQLLRRRVLTGR